MKSPLGALFLAAAIYGLVPPRDLIAADIEPANKIGVVKTLRASKLPGLNVRNPAGEKLGVVHDIALNVEDGKIAYLALSHGGVLGVGDKLFAVPYSQVAFNHGKEEMWFVLDMTKEKLNAAPGFDQRAWPDFADPKWRDEVDRYYRVETRRDTTTVSEKKTTVKETTK